MKKQSHDGVEIIPAPIKEKKFNGSRKAKERRKRVIERLEAQLKAGTKNYIDVKEYYGAFDPVSIIQPLTSKDIERIKKEITILRSRI